MSLTERERKLLRRAIEALIDLKRFPRDELKELKAKMKEKDQ